MTRRSANPEVQESECATCADVGWLCCHTGGPADLDGGSCCSPHQELMPGEGCLSADGCRDCDRALAEFKAGAFAVFLPKAEEA